MATWYADYSSGDDTTGDGKTAATAYKTIAKCITESSASDTIECAEDTYLEAIQPNKDLNINAATGATVTLQPASGAYVMDVETNATDVVTDGIDFDGSNLDNANSKTIMSDNTNTVEIKNSTVIGSGGNTTDYPFHMGTGCTLTLDTVVGTSPTDGSDVIYIGWNKPLTITNSVLTAAGAGKDVVHDANGAAGLVIDLYNSVLSCTDTGTTTSQWCVDTARGIVYARECTFINDSTAVSQDAGGIQAGLSEAASDHLIHHNTFDCPLSVYIGSATVNGTCQLKNNIFVANLDHTNAGCVRFHNAGSETATQLDYNQYWLAAGSNPFYGYIAAASTTLANWRTATGQEANGQDGTPAFTARSTDDYTLTAASACINQGVYVGVPYTGTAPDIGAEQYTISVDAGVGIGQLDRNDDTKQMLIVVAGTLYECDVDNDVYTPVGGGFTASDTNYWSLISFSDTLWCINEGEVLHKWSGDDYITGTIAVTQGSTTATGTSTDFDGYLGEDGFIKVDAHGLWHRIAAAGSDTGLTLTTAYTGPTGTGLDYTATTYQPAGGSPPTGKILVKWDNRLWITGNSTNPRRIYFSAANNGDSWTVASLFVTTVDAPVSLVPMDSFLLVLARDRSWVIQPTEQVDTPYSVQEFTNVGCISHQSMAKDGSLIFGLTEEGVRIINGVDNPIISDPIQDKLLALEKSRWKYAFGFIDKPKHKYLLLMTSSGETQHDRLYAYDYMAITPDGARGRWDSEDTLGVPFNCMGVVEDSSDVPHIYGLGYDGYLYEYETTATTDDGTAIGVVAESALIDGGDPTSLMRLMEVAVDADAGYTSIDIEHKPDGVATGSGTTSTLTAANSTKIAGGRDGVSAYPQAQNLATAFQLRLTHSAAEAFKCHGIGVGLIPLEGEDS